MAKPTLCASEIGKKKANNAFKFSGKTQEFIAGKSITTRQRVANFLDGANVEKQIFISICEALELDWRDIAGIEDEIEDNTQKDIEALVQLVRKQCASDIIKRCGTMQILTMPQEIGLGEIYTDVKLFERVQGKRFLTEKEYFADLDATDWEQTGFAGLELCKDRLDGLEVVSQFLRLMVLGRPGAGKTTFLKHLAFLCNAGKFEPEHVPIFVTLQDYARNEESLESFIRRKWKENCGISDSLVLKNILDSGQALILLDGLDEVLESRRLDVIRAIENLAEAYDQARIVVTCRIAAKEYIFPKFREVQVAEFDEGQIRSFVSKWFEQDKERISKFFAKLEERPRIKHQAPNPLLLTFLCLIFEDRNDFYENRALLYEKGIDLLMERWDSSREKERDEVYKGLSTQRKEEMLSLLAFETFREGLLLFSRDHAANCIATYIKDLRDVIGDRDTLLANGRKIVTSVESQHGLLTERFDGVYSFSHLTFHEYFAAYEIVRVQQSSPDILEELVSHLFDKKWREVFLLTVEMSPQRSTNHLLLNMKIAIDNLLAEDEKLQSFLQWVDSKSRLVMTPYQLIAIRAYYFAFFRIYFGVCFLSDKFGSRSERRLNLDLEIACAFKLKDLYIEHIDGSDINLINNFDLIRVLDRDILLILNRDHIHKNDIEFIDQERKRDNKSLEMLLRCFDLDFDNNFNLDDNFYRNAARIFNRAFNRVLYYTQKFGSKHLYHQLQELKNLVPDAEQNWETFNSWWDLNGKKWTEELRLLIIQYYNIGHDWKFTEEQEQKLNHYYKANQLLVECLKSDCNISREVRQKIEDTLLLSLLHPDNQT